MCTDSIRNIPKVQGINQHSPCSVLAGKRDTSDM